MIERDFVQRKKKEFQIREFIDNYLSGVGLSHSKIQRTPLGEKIIINASRPGLVIGGGGSNIKKLTRDLKKEFDLENPQIEINEVENDSLVAAVVAERIAGTLERYGPVRFKGVGHKAMADVLNSGAKGVEIIISGKIPSSRARRWRFYQGYIKKCGNAATEMVDTAYKKAQLKSGIVGVKVSIMPPNVRLPDDVKYEEPQMEELYEESEKSEKKESKSKSDKKDSKKSEKASKEESGKKKTKKEKKTSKKSDKESKK